MLIGPRGRFETVVDLLMVLVEGVRKPTRIQLRANLSWNASRNYLEKLERAELVVVGKYDGSDPRTTRIYDITPKGRDFLKMAKKTLEALEEIFEEN